MNPFPELAWSGVGFACGFVLALLLVMAWVALADAAKELLCEKFLDPRRTSGSVKVAPPREVSQLYSVLISDIHLDTWTYPNDDTKEDPNHPKRLAFRQFLNWIHSEPRIKDLYINGDVMDLPPHPLNQPPTPMLRVEDGNPNTYPDLLATPYLGSLSPLNNEVLSQLGTLDRRDPSWPVLKVTYITGNHDIGMYGLRYIQPDLTWNSVRVAWNPSIVLKTLGDTRLYMEHGHLRDPFMWLYLRYAVVELLQGPEAVAQRGGKVGMTRASGVKSVAIDALPTEKQYFEGTGSMPLPKGEGFGALLARLRFRQAARKLFHTVDVDDGHKVDYLTMGHTHLPDRYVFPTGQTYINSGDWAGNDTNCTFVLIHPSGAVTGPHQWRPGTTLDDLEVG